MKDAIEEFSRKRAEDSRKLVQLSRSGDRPGIYGLLGFVVPIMMDALFMKVTPGLFAPPVPALIQNENYSFAQVARRKRMDRILQLLILGCFASFSSATLNLFVAKIAESLRRSVTTIYTSLTLPFLLYLVTRKYAVPAIVQRTKS